VFNGGVAAAYRPPTLARGVPAGVVAAGVREGVVPIPGVPMRGVLALVPASRSRARE